MCVPIITFQIENSCVAIKNEWIVLDNMANELIKQGKLEYRLYSFYQTYEWNSLLEKSYLYSLKKKVSFVTVRNKGNLVAILPLLMNRHSHSITILDGRFAGILNLVMLPSKYGMTKLAVNKLIEFLTMRYKSWCLNFHSIPADSIFYKELSLMKGVAVRKRGSYHIPLSKFGKFETYFNSLSKGIRQNIRTSYNRLALDGLTYNLEIYSPKKVPPVSLLVSLWNLYYRRKYEWKNKNVSAIRRFICYIRAVWVTNCSIYKNIIKDAGQLRIFILRINKFPAAFLIAIEDKEHIIVPKLAIDSSFKRYSPGYLLIVETLRYGYKVGISDFDLCRGDEEYKLKIGGVREEIGNVIFLP